MAQSGCQTQGQGSGGRVLGSTGGRRERSKAARRARPGRKVSPAPLAGAEQEGWPPSGNRHLGRNPLDSRPRRPCKRKSGVGLRPRGAPGGRRRAMAAAAVAAACGIIHRSAAYNRPASPLAAPALRVLFQGSGSARTPPAGAPTRSLRVSGVGRPCGACHGWPAACCGLRPGERAAGGGLGGAGFDSGRSRRRLRPLALGKQRAARSGVNGGCGVGPRLPCTGQGCRRPWAPLTAATAPPVHLPAPARRKP